MNDPMKIIWKYKNNNRRIQYNTYIFVGTVMPNDIMSILESFANTNLYDTLINLDKSKYNKLEKFYGEMWYYKFFNTYHINATIFQIKESQTQKDEITDIYGKEWYAKHIAGVSLIEKKLIYSYESLIKGERNNKVNKKVRAMGVDDDGDVDYTLTKKIDITKFFNKNEEIHRQNRDETHKTHKQNRSEHEEADSTSSLKISDSIDSTDSISDSNDDNYDMMGGGVICESCSKNKCRNCPINKNANIVDIGEDNIYPQKYEFKVKLINEPQIGGDDDDIEEEYQNTDEILDDDAIVYNDEAEMDSDAEEAEENDEEAEEAEVFDRNIDEIHAEEEMDAEEIEKMYQESEVAHDVNMKETNKLIKKIMGDEKLFEKKMKNMIEFDTSRNNDMYDENLKNVFKKYYVKDQYIFKDDTIRTIREKICGGIKCNPIFSKDDEELFLIPSRQYFWSEYYYDKKINKIMIGQKWMRKNELLNVDVEPANSMRVYEELREPLKTLKENIRRYNNKIRREDDDNNILFDYDNYYTNNEIFMMDLYNEFGLNYAPDGETIKNLQDVYLRIYFPRVKTDDIKSLIDFLNGNRTTEINKVQTIYENINSDLVIENEIINTTENVKMNDKYQYLFKDNYITQSVIHLNVRFKEESKLNLFRIFNEFLVDDQYPFVQYQTPDGNISYKFGENQISQYIKEKDNKNVLYKWFENAPYGISFKVKINDRSGVKFMAIGLNENGRIEYKTQWKEEDMATINDIKITYDYVRNLLKKLNLENNKFQAEQPDDSEFKFAFINTIQKFILPNNYIINHNNLSNFSRYFYPYVALVIDPRKRQAKVPKTSDKSKFGTYLRYKRVSKYENQARIEQRIMYFIRNFEFTEKALANEIGKQFNITEAKAIEEYERVKAKYPNLKKSRKILKKLENIPKYKPPGIGIDIQGKHPEKYKIRISGARDKVQLQRIISFMNILIFLYVETYHLKKKERQDLIKKLEMFTNVAERRNKVEDVGDYSKEFKNVKQMTQIDKRRIGFKPEKGQNQWTRSCQNSGDDKKRRPQQYNSQAMDELLKKGYALNKKTGNYERKIIQKDKNGKKTEIVLRTVTVGEIDEEGNATGNEIHYACDPDENGEHFYVGFLTRSMNPFGHCMPCCFKKDPMISKNKEKKEFFKKCLGNTDAKAETQNQKVIGDRLYILQDTNKIQEGRFGFLPKYLDIYFNYALEKQKKIKHHYLVKTETGYFFKYGSKQDEYQFLNAVSSIFGLTLDEIINKVITYLEKDKNDQLFTSLNNGDIKTQFGTKAMYASFILSKDAIDYEMINNIISLPNVLTKHGLNIVVFQKKNIIIKKTFEKEKIREDFILNCQNPEDITGLRSDRDCIFLIKENKNYYPIVMVYKEDESTKSMEIFKTFKYEKNATNIVNHVNNFYEKNCIGSFVDTFINKTATYIAKLMSELLSRLSDEKYHPKAQFIDVRNKCKYIITAAGYIVPVRPSGSLFNLQVIRNIDKYILDYEKTIHIMENLYKISDKKIPTKPSGVYCDDDSKDTKKVTGIVTITNDIIPIVPTNVKLSVLKASNLQIIIKPLSDKIDLQISKGKSNFVVDDRIISVKKNDFNLEAYELFRLEFSEYINRSENSNIKNKLTSIISDSSSTRKSRVEKVKLILYRVIDKKLYNIYKSIISASQGHVVDIIKDDEIDDVASESSESPEKESLDKEQTGGKAEKFMNVASKPINLNDYSINNDRIVCKVINAKDKCNVNKHCRWTHSGCFMNLPKEETVIFINKLSEELAQNELKASEILQTEGYFVSDIVDYNRFTVRNNQKIIRSTSNNINKVMNDFFGNDNVSVKIGRRKTTKVSEVNYQQLNADHPLADMKTFYVQSIIENNLTLFRAYVNCYYWLQNKYSDMNVKNLGYYSLLQTDLANYFRSLMIDWLNDPQHAELVKNDMDKYFEKKSHDTVGEFIIRLIKNVPIMTNCVVELYVLSKINNTPIVVYNDFSVPIYIFDNGLLYDSFITKTLPSHLNKYVSVENKNIINLRFVFVVSGKTPEKIESMYFKEQVTTK